MTRALPLLLLLCACGVARSAFEGTWTGTVTRAFQCEPLGNGSSSDFAVTATVTPRPDGALDVDLGDAYGCDPVLGVEQNPGLLTLGDAGCPTTDAGGITNTRTLAGGEFQVGDAGVAALTLFEDDVGDTPQSHYICHGTSYGLLVGGD